MATPNLYYIPSSDSQTPVGYEFGKTPKEGDGLPAIKQEDLGFFGGLLSNIDEKDLTPGEQKDRKIMMLLLKVKNGTP